MMHCIGCGRNIPWDGKRLFSYTCKCGSTTFVGGDDRRYVRVSIEIQMIEKSPVIHLDDIVGESNHTSKEKTAFIAQLRDIGFIWMHECVQCKTDGTLQLKQEREEYHKRTARRTRDEYRG